MNNNHYYAVFYNPGFPKEKELIEASLLCKDAWDLAYKLNKEFKKKYPSSIQNPYKVEAY